MTLGERLRSLRGPLSQADFGSELGVSQPTVRNYENGARLPDSDFVKNVCNKFGISADWLLFGKEDQKIDDDVPQKDSDPIPETERGPPRSFPPRSKPDTSPPDLLNDYITALRQLADLQRELTYLQRENGDLRVEVERLAARIARLEKDPGEALRCIPEETPKEDPRIRNV